MRANEMGYGIGLPWLTRDAAKHGLRIRPRPPEKPGRHKQEVEWHRLAAYLLESKKPHSRPNPEEEEGCSKEDVERRIRQASERKRQDRPLN
jgi:hypothetical protein